ncbi:hypothetical protein L1987_75480 [Smallanthus sonchifolius]|uniref:Uncharacterized protein n=1 Tax=Smallanthus sonchifolius TaxID=185202 RepID=A0ACB9A5J3_9ASTR|nr:hypothetical protein L1987_75480 [Smallanthus sonchifolius]
MSSRSDLNALERGAEPLDAASFPTMKYSDPFFSCAKDDQCIDSQRFAVNMVLGLKFQLPHHPISSIPLHRNPQTILNPFFQIQTRSFSHLQLKSRSINPKASSSKALVNNGGGGGGVEDPRKDRDGDGDADRDEVKLPWLYLRWAELLLGRDRHNVVAVGLPGTLGWVCAQVAWRLYLIMIEVTLGIVQLSLYICCAGAFFTFSVIGTLLWLWH